MRTSLSRWHATRGRAALAVAGLLMVLAALSPAAAATVAGTAPVLALRPSATVRVVPPPVDATADYQLGGGYQPAAGVRIVTRDVTERSAPKTYGICYVNAFQTQPGTAHWWLAQHPGLVLRTASGVVVHDPGWPDELLLDTSTAVRRASLASVFGVFLSRCSGKGYRAVELDNLDSWSRSGGRLTMRENASYATILVARAHALGLAVAQKNDVAMLALRRSIGFDFAVVEECQAYAECSSFTRVYGAHVIEIEYTDNGGRANFAAACRARGASISIIYRDRDLVRRGTRGYVYVHC